jgi:hypothetical protein
MFDSYEPLETNHCLFAKLLVLSWRFFKNVQITNMAGLMQSFDKFQHKTVKSIS